MRRPPGSPAVALRLLGAAGTVVAALAAHVGAGAALPSPSVAVVAVLAVFVLASLAARLPSRLRVMRLGLAAAVALQPVLHVAFELSAPGQPLAAGAGLMVLAHLTAAGAALWWSARGIARIGAAAERLAARLRPVHRLSATGDVAFHGPTAGPVFVRSRLLWATAYRRGPPTEAHPLPVV